MAWTVPKTFVAGNRPLSSELNTYIRDNLLETEAAKATEAGQIMVTSAENAVAMQKVVASQANDEVTTSSSTPVTLGGGTPNVSVTHSGAMLILFAAQMRQVSGSGPANCAPEVVGTDAAATIARAIQFDQPSLSRYSGHALYYSPGPGTHTVRLRYWSEGGTSSFARREICVIPL